MQLHFIESIDDVLAMREWAGQRRETPVGVDTESEGLDPSRHRLRLAQLGDKRHGWAMPDIWCGAFLDIIRDMLRRGESLVAHNSGFDHRVISHSLGFSIPWHALHDTLIIAALADPTRPKGLKPLSTRLIDRNAAAGQKLLDDGMRANGWDWATVPAGFPPYHLYAALDPVLTCHIWDLLAPRVLDECPEAYDLERATVPVLASMMDAGLLLDREYVGAQVRRLRAYTTSARAWLGSYYGIESLMSARQIEVALLAHGVEITQRTGTGLPSVTKEVLQAFLTEGVPSAAAELITTVLKARHAEKMVGTYFENFLERLAADGCIHPSINQLPARTSRMSCSEPNLQNLPRDDKVVRGSFIPHPGYVLISVDASQIEMRLFAAASGDAGLIAAFQRADETGIDFYSVLATELFGTPIEKKDKRRQSVKSASYARIYGAGVAKMALTAGVPVEQMRPVNDALGQRFPGMNSWPGSLLAEMRQMSHRGEQPGTRTSTNRWLPVDEDSLYAVTNYRLQAEAAECLKRGGAALAAAGFQDAMRLFIHDEVILEVREEDADEALRAAIKVLTDANDRYAVPITWDGVIMPERWVKS